MGLFCLVMSFIRFVSVKNGLDIGRKGMFLGVCKGCICNIVLCIYVIVFRNCDK